MEDVLQNSYYKSPLGYAIVDWFVDEVIKLEKKMSVFLKKTEKDIIMTEEDEEDEKFFCRFCEKNYGCDKVRDHCHFTGFH